MFESTIFLYLCLELNEEFVLCISGDFGVMGGLGVFTPITPYEGLCLSNSQT